MAELKCARLLTKLDVGLLALFCEEFAFYIEACEFVAAHGEFFPVKKRGEVQDLRPYPAVSQRAQSIASMVRIARELGLSPGARSRIVLPNAHTFRFCVVMKDVLPSVRLRNRDGK